MFDAVLGSMGIFTRVATRPRAVAGWTTNWDWMLRNVPRVISLFAIYQISVKVSKRGDDPDSLAADKEDSLSRFRFTFRGLCTLQRHLSELAIEALGQKQFKT